NSSEVEVLPNTRDVRLPESTAEMPPRENVVVLVTDDEVLVQGRVVARIADVMANDAIVIPELKEALERQTERALSAQMRDDATQREVTIMGDRDLPYRLLKKIMATCTEADYGRLSLAVMQKAAELPLAAARGD